jgi:hypothetical protein
MLFSRSMLSRRKIDLYYLDLWFPTTINNERELVLSVHCTLLLHPLIESRLNDFVLIGTSLMQALST